MKERIEFIATEKISFPPRNPRPKESLNQHALEDLARSIQQKGVLVPILVRMIDDDRYELVAGQRRLLACRFLEHATVPALVRELTADEALELAITENLQRADLHFLDEAQVFADLQSHAKLDPAQIAERLGKSLGYIRQRLALVNLLPYYKELARKDLLSVMGAVQIARLNIGEQRLMKKECKWVIDRGDALTAGAIRRLLEQNVYQVLKNAPFDIADPKLDAKAGPCTTCPKSTAGAPALFADIDGEATCTDPHCFAGKCTAHVMAIHAKHPDAIPIALGHCYQHDAAIKKMKVKKQDLYNQHEAGTWRPAKGETCEATVTGLVYFAESSKDMGRMLKVCTDLRCPLHTGAEAKDQQKKVPGVMPKWRLEQIEKSWQMRAEKASRLTIHSAIRERAFDYDLGDLSASLLQTIARELTMLARTRQPGTRRLMELYGKAGIDGMLEAIDGAARKQDLLVIILDLLVAEEAADPRTDGELVRDLAKAVGLDPAAIRKPIDQDIAEKKKAADARREARLKKEAAQAKEGRKNRTPAKRGPRKGAKKKGGAK